MDKIYKNIVESKYNNNKIKKIYFMETLGQIYTLLSNNLDWLLKFEYDLDFEFKKFIENNNCSLDANGWEVASTLLSQTTTKIYKDEYKELIKISNQLPDMIFMGKRVNDDTLDTEKLFNEIQKITKNIKFEVFSNYARELLTDVGYFEFKRTIIWQIVDLIKLTYTKYNTFYFDGTKYNEISIYDKIEDNRLYNWRDMSLAISCSDVAKTFVKENPYNIAFTKSLLNRMDKDCNMQTLRDVVFKFDGIQTNIDPDFLRCRGNNAVNLSDNTKSFYHTKDTYDIIKDKKLYTNSSEFKDFLVSIRTIIMTEDLFKMDMKHRTNLFRVPTNIKIHLKDGWLDGSNYNFTIYEYIIDDKLCIFAHCESEHFSNYYFIYDNDIQGLMNQAITTTETMGIIILLSILGFGEQIKQYCKKTLEITVTMFKLNEKGHVSYSKKCNDIISYIDNITNEEKHTILETREFKNKTWTTISLKKVQPFIRRLPIGQIMSDEAKKIEKDLKIEVPSGYTIVTEHYRSVKHK